MISAQNIVYYRDTLLNKVYRARICRCILSPFPCPLICHGIRTAAVRGYSRSNPAKRIRRPGHCVPCLRQSQTSRRRFGNFRISENDFRYRSTVLPGACQSLSHGAAPKGRNRFFPICCSSRRRRYRLLFYSPPNPPAGSGTVPARTRLPGTFGDNTVPAHSNIIGGVQYFAVREHFLIDSQIPVGIPRAFFSVRDGYIRVQERSGRGYHLVDRSHPTIFRYIFDPALSVIGEGRRACFVKRSMVLQYPEAETASAEEILPSRSAR